MRDIRIRDSIPSLVARLFRQVARVNNRALKRFDLSAVHTHILALLWLEGPMTIGELQKALALGSSTLTGALDRMEKANLVRRAPVPGDRRATRIEPAAWPEKRRNAVIDALTKTEAECFEKMTATERKDLVRLLHKAIDSIQEHDDGED